MDSQPALILLVDDNANDVYFTQRAFTRNNINDEIVVCHDGVEALDLLLPGDGREALHPAIVLLDINMPKIGGFEVLARLRAHTSTLSLPVIVLTSSPQDQEVVQGYRLGANSYVSKPVAPDEFLAAATALGVDWLGLNHQTTGSNEPSAPRAR